MTTKSILATLHEAQQRLGRFSTRRDLGAVIAQLEDAAVATAMLPGHTSIIWALGALGRAAAAEKSWGCSHLVDCALGHLAAARKQLRAAAAGANPAKEPS